MSRVNVFTCACRLVGRVPVCINMYMLSTVPRVSRIFLSAGCLVVSELDREFRKEHGFQLQLEQIPWGDVHQLLGTLGTVPSYT